MNPIIVCSLFPCSEDTWQLITIIGLAFFGFIALCGVAVAVNWIIRKIWKEPS